MRVQRMMGVNKGVGMRRQQQLHMRIVIVIELLRSKHGDRGHVDMPLSLATDHQPKLKLRVINDGEICLIASERLCRI
jgi:hypothetical protein